jgi:hypothetical protein
VLIVSQTVTPTTVAPGGSAVEALTVLNCTDVALSTSVTFYGTWNANGVSTLPVGCAAMDPLPVPLSLPPHASVTTTFTLQVPATCTATSLTARAKVSSTAVSSVEVAIVASLPSCSATVQHHSWPGGFVTDVKVRNVGSIALNGWTVGVTYGGDNHVTGAWNAAVTQSGHAVTATNLSYNTALPAGASIEFGTIGTWKTADAAPGAVTLGGHPCQLT